MPDTQLLPISGFVFAICLLIALRVKTQTPVYTAFFSFGLMYALIFSQFQLNQQLKQPTHSELIIKIDSLPKYSTNKVSFIGINTANNERYLLNFYAQQEQDVPELDLDHLYHIDVNLKPPHGSINGVGFDRERWLFRHGIDGIGNIKSWQIMDTKQYSFKTYITQWRAALSDSINQHFEHPRTNALIHALSIGDKSHFEHQDMEMFQNTGTAHLIAISGLHIGMVALLGWLLGGLIFKLSPKQNLPKPVLQILIGLLFAIFYACLAGLAVSTQRAVIMLLVLGCYKLFRRPAYAWDVWSTSLLLVLIIDPLNVLDNGFWLSFIAVAVLILAFNGQPQRNHQTISFFKMQLTLLIGMLPLSLVVFSRLNLMAPVVNLMMIPVMTFLLIPGLLILLLLGSLAGNFPSFLVSWIEWISLLMIQVLDWFNQFSWLALNTSITSWWQYLVLIPGALWLILPAAIPQRFWGVVLIFFGLYNPINKPHNGQFNAHFLDVGQGLSVVIETQNHHLVYDVGAAYDSGFNMADAVLLPFLQQHQINHLNALVLSHQDNDHSGAASHLLQQIKVNEVWGTESSHRACVAGTEWTWDGVKFSFLSPNNLTPYLRNNSSCVLKVEAVNTRLLLTGDIEEPVEYRLQQLQNNVIQADVLLVPHHGSNTSSSTDFITAVNPELAINSSGQFNAFNHPTVKIIQRYQQLNIPIIDTQFSGLITLNTYPALKVQQFRSNNPRIWRKKKPE